MSDFLTNFGVNWKLLLAQAVNFGVLLVVLRFTIYKPLSRLLAERRNRIEEGLRNADHASRRLAEAETVKRQKLSEAEAESVALLKRTEEKSKAVEARLLGEARKKEAEIIAKAEERGEALVSAEREKFYADAASLLRSAIVKLVYIKQDVIDEKLIDVTIKKVKPNL